MNHSAVKLITAGIGVFAVVFATAAASAGEKKTTSGAHLFDKGMQPILASYLKIQAALAGDTMKGVQPASQAIAKEAKRLDGTSVTGEHAAHYAKLPQKLQAAATALAAEASIDRAREAFKELSKPMALWGSMSKPAGIDVVFCSMAKGSWLQKSGAVRNPYHGASMLACGEVVGGADHATKAMKHGKHGGH